MQRHLTFPCFIYIARCFFSLHDSLVIHCPNSQSGHKWKIEGGGSTYILSAVDQCCRLLPQ